MFNNPADPQQLLPRHPGRRRRHRGLRLGQRCCCASTCKYCERKGFKTEVDGRDRRATSPASRAPRSRSRANTPSACCAPKPACTGWCASRRSTRRAGATRQFRQRVRLPGGRRLDRDRHQPGRRAHRHLPRLGRGRPAHQQDRLGGAPDAHARPASSCSARTTAASTATATRPGGACARACTTSRCASAWKSSRSWKTPRPTSAGATRSAATCWTRAASRTCAPTSRSRNTQKVLDGDLDPFIEASLKQGV